MKARASACDVMVIRELGEMTYKAYRRSILSVDGVKSDGFPEWENLPEEIQTAWREAGMAAVAGWIQRVSFDSICRAMLGTSENAAGEHQTKTGDLK